MSATWDDKGTKANPVAADEVLIIDTEDSRNPALPRLDARRSWSGTRRARTPYARQAREPANCRGPGRPRRQKLSGPTWPPHISPLPAADPARQ